MSETATRLTEVFEAARANPLSFHDTSRIVFFSDYHRGDNGWADDFAHNQLVAWHALGWYFDEGFTYVEAGDGDELWENADFDEIYRAHDHVFWQLQRFHEASRLHLLWGNHDIERRDAEVVRRQLHRVRDKRTRQEKSLLEGVEVREGLVLRHVATGQEIFVVHGHQGDPWNDDQVWMNRVWLSRAAVRHVWKPAQLWGANDPTRASQNLELRLEVEHRLCAWARDNRQPTICGHTHQSYFPEPGDAPYFNTGSCIHPRCITGIEIDGGRIGLVKWWTKPRDDGVMRIVREQLAGPRPLREFFG